MKREAFNTFGPTVAGHTMAAYRCLPHGWRPRPPGEWSDLYMWRQFFDQRELTFATIPRVTTVKFGNWIRRDWTTQMRQEEIESWWKRLQRTDPTPWLEREALRSLSERAIHLDIDFRAENVVAKLLRRTAGAARRRVKAMLTPN